MLNTIKITQKTILVFALAILCALICGLLTSSYAYAEAINPNTPKSVHVKRDSSNSLKVYWQKIQDAKGVEIYRYNKEKKKYVKVGQTKNKNFYIDKKLEKNKVYRYKVRVFNKVGGKTYRSNYSYWVKAITTSSKSKKVNVGKIKGESEITIGIRQKIKPKYKFKNIRAWEENKALDLQLHYSVTNKNKLTVSKNGTLQGKEVGESTLVLRAHNGNTKKVKVKIVNWAYPERFFTNSIPLEFQHLYTTQKQDVMDIANYFLRHPKLGEGSVCLTDDGAGPVMQISKGLKLGDMHDRMEKLLLECPWDLRVNIWDLQIDFDIQFNKHKKISSFFWYFDDLTDTRSDEVGYDRIAPHWFYERGFGE